MIISRLSGSALIWFSILFFIEPHIYTKQNKNNLIITFIAAYHTDNIAIPGIHGCRGVDSGG